MKDNYLLACVNVKFTQQSKPGLESDRPVTADIGCPLCCVSTLGVQWKQTSFVACKTYADIWRNKHGACTAGVLVRRVFAEHWL